MVWPQRGLSSLLEMLREGDQSPIWNLSDALDNLLQSDIYSEEHPIDTLNEVLRQ